MGDNIHNFESRKQDQLFDYDGSSAGDLIVESPKVSSRGLERMIDQTQLAAIHDLFKTCHLMTYDEFRNILKKIINLELNNEDYNVLFMKIDSKADGYIDWDEFISHILLEYQEKDIQVTGQQLELPLSGVPRIQRSRHRHPVSRITFCPSVTMDRTADYSTGKYLTVSHDGMINYWNVDMKFERTVYSTSPELKVHSTWVTDIVCLPDVNILCTSSSERDLRFYDVTANNFQLRLMIIGLESPVVCMDYHFNQNIEEKSVLVCGNQQGEVIILTFSTELKGPFHHKLGEDIVTIHWDQLVRVEVSKICVQVFPAIHDNWVRQVKYYYSLNSFLSCSLSTKNSLYLSDINGTKSPYSYKVPSGVFCFDICEESHLIATGGPDQNVRIWNAFIPKKANMVFQGHHAPVISVILQDSGKRVYSLAKDKVIKVWSLEHQTCIQIYNRLIIDFVYEVSMNTYYNPNNRNFIIGGKKFAILLCGKLLDKTITDGHTHTDVVTAALYNPLFKSLVTVGRDSCIILWDPWIGKMKSFVKDAHTKMEYGKMKAVGITAATYNPEYQLLLTGAEDGTLKMWNFNTGTCMRRMNIEHGCEVTSVTWLKGRIIAMGWNRHVTEFTDAGRSTQGKSWATRHTDDILCASVRQGQTIATASYAGELIFWRLETGQSYKIYNVTSPYTKAAVEQLADKNTKTETDMSIKESVKSRKTSVVSTKAAAEELTDTNTKTETDMSIKESVKSRKTSVVSTKAAAEELTDTNTKTETDISINKESVKSRKTSVVSTKHETNDSKEPSVEIMATLLEDVQPHETKPRYVRRVSVIELPEAIADLQPLSVHAIVFLSTRPMLDDCGTLLCALNNGIIQVWSHHAGGGYKGEFFAIHVPGDYVISMATDENNEYLFTGHAAGYIKVWLLTNYMMPENLQKRIVMPLIRLQFPFLWRDRVVGRAKRTLRNQPLPMLLSSHQGHLRGVTCIEYISECKVIISCSADRTVRFWTLGGKYLGTLGSFRPWIHLSPDKEASIETIKYPPDIQKVMSSTTLKVLNGGQVSRATIAKSVETETIREVPSDLRHWGTYGKRVELPILGHHFKIPSRVPRIVYPPKIDTTFRHIPVYTHLKCHDLMEVKRMSTPKVTTEAIIMAKSENPNIRSSNTEDVQK